MIKQAIHPNSGEPLQDYFVDCDNGLIYSKKQTDTISEIITRPAGRKYLHLKFRVYPQQQDLYVHRVVWASYYECAIPIKNFQENYRQNY